MLLIGKPRSINDLRNYQSTYTVPARDRVRICVVDNEDFPPLERLRRNNFSIIHLRDAENVSAVAEYDIVLADIQGVATRLSENFEGAFLIKEIRKRYPSKVVIAFTAQMFNASYNDYFRHADTMIVKDSTTETWVENLDHAIELAVDPIYQWKKLRSYLLDQDVALANVMRFEDDYVRNVLGERAQFPTPNLLPTVSEDVRAILQSFTGSLLFKLLLG